MVLTVSIQAENGFGGVCLESRGPAFATPLTVCRVYVGRWRCLVFRNATTNTIWRFEVQVTCYLTLRCSCVKHAYNLLAAIFEKTQHSQFYVDVLQRFLRVQYAALKIHTRLIYHDYLYRCESEGHVSQWLFLRIYTPQRTRIYRRRQVTGCLISNLLYPPTNQW